MLNVEEEYLDVLQNIEFAIVGVCQRMPLLVDFDVENAISALITHYHAQAQGHEGRLPRLNERAKEVYDQVEAMCDWRLGKDVLVSADMKNEMPRPASVTLEAIVLCLKRIRKSVQLWNREGGRRGYLTFIQRFVK